MATTIVKNYREYLQNFHYEATHGQYKNYSDEGSAICLAQKVYNLYQGGQKPSCPKKEADIVNKVMLFRAQHSKYINLHDERGRW